MLVWLVLNTEIYFLYHQNSALETKKTFQELGSTCWAIFSFCSANLCYCWCFHAARVLLMLA